MNAHIKQALNNYLFAVIGPAALIIAMAFALSSCDSEPDANVTTCTKSHTEMVWITVYTGTTYSQGGVPIGSGLEMRQIPTDTCDNYETHHNPDYDDWHRHHPEAFNKEKPR